VQFVTARGQKKYTSVWAERWRGIKFALGAASPFGLTEIGAQDYRGIPFRRKVIVGAMITDVDFTAADLNHMRLENCFLRRCSFDRADLTELVTRATQFEDCSFKKADLRRAHIGYYGTDFKRCKFDGARTERVGFLNAVFSDVEFIGQDWNHTDFRASGFWNCRFKGTLKDVAFRGDYLMPLERKIAGPPQRTGLHTVSFRDTELHWVGTHNGCVLESVTLPANSSAFICEVTALNSTYISYEQRSNEYEVFDKYMKIILPGTRSQVEKIISKYDLVELGGMEIGTTLYERLKSILLKV
jgi:hypothetical protein